MYLAMQTVVSMVISILFAYGLSIYATLAIVWLWIAWSESVIDEAKEFDRVRRPV